MRNIKRPPPTDDQNITSQKGIGLGYNPGGCQEQGHYNQERERLGWRATHKIRNTSR